MESRDSIPTVEEPKDVFCSASNEEISIPNLRFNTTSNQLLVWTSQVPVPVEFNDTKSVKIGKQANLADFLVSIAVKFIHRD
jgi:hypothetical protein